jgi:hypothetical protein
MVGSARPVHGCSNPVTDAATTPSHLTSTLVTRVLAVAAIVVGAVLLAFDPNRWDVVVLTLPRGHGIHSHDVLGMAMVTLGITTMWYAPRRMSAR